MHNADKQTGTRPMGQSQQQQPRQPWGIAPACQHPAIVQQLIVLLRLSGLVVVSSYPHAGVSQRCHRQMCVRGTKHLIALVQDMD